MSEQPRIESRRATDKGWLCSVALRASQLWEWIDKRQIDKHVVSVAILYGTIELTNWATTYATTSTRPGLEIAAIVAAVTGPYMALQAAAIGFYFNYRRVQNG